MALRETDIVTGLYTPGFLIAFGARELAFAIEQGYPLSVITARLEGTGELKDLGDLVRNATGEGSIVAMLDDNEVAALLPGVGRDKASEIARRIEKTAHAGVSIGSATSSAETGEFPELLRRARLAIGGTNR